MTATPSMVPFRSRLSRLTFLVAATISTISIAVIKTGVYPRRTDTTIVQSFTGEWVLRDDLWRNELAALLIAVPFLLALLAPVIVRWVRSGQ